MILQLQSDLISIATWESAAILRIPAMSSKNSWKTGKEFGFVRYLHLRHRIFSNNEEQFLIYYFGEILKSDVLDQANGTAIKNIPPFKEMKAMRIDLPSFPEQTEIVRLLDDLLTKESRPRKRPKRCSIRSTLSKKPSLPAPSAANCAPMTRQRKAHWSWSNELSRRRGRLMRIHRIQI